jgi:transposase
MMGLHQKQTELWVEPINLGRRVPEDHILRKLNKMLDLGFVRDEVAKFYGRNGNVSVDPVVIMKMMLLLFLDDVKSERELVRIIPLRIDYLWYLGYGLEDEVPDHSVLSKARARWGEEVFKGLFQKTVTKCLEAGLIDGSKLHVDSSLVRANASKNSIVEKVCAEALGKLEEQPGMQADREHHDDEDKRPPNQRKQSTTDPDATMVRQGGGKSEPSYKNHRVVDDKEGVITALKTTTGMVNEAHELIALAQQHEANTGRSAEVVVADCKYGIAGNFAELAAQKIRSHMGDFRARQNNPRQQGIFEYSHFKYDKATDTYICPARERLYRRHMDIRGQYEYITRTGVCARCTLREQCTRSRNGRTLKRHPNQSLLDRARRQSHSRAAILDRKRRQHFQERNFADAANHHGFKRARWRGLIRQSIQDLLIAGLQNLRLLARKANISGKKSFMRQIAALITENLLAPLIGVVTPRTGCLTRSQINHQNPAEIPAFWATGRQHCTFRPPAFVG